MEDYKMKQSTIYKRYIKRRHALIFVFMFIFCKTAFSDSMSVSPESLVVDVQESGTATVKILNNLESPLSNISVSASSDKESVATVIPVMVLTDANGQAFFSVTGLSNGTATISFNAKAMSNSLSVTVLSNIAPCAVASSSGGGIDEFGPEMMNDGLEKEDCTYHWIRTQKEIGQKKRSWIRLDWNEYVTVNRMTIQTTDCDESCGEDSDDSNYIDPGRNLGNGVVQYLDGDEITWITDGEFEEETGDVEYSFTKSITTKAIRIKKVSPSTLCDGQQSNPVVFEWKVYGTPSCE